MQRFTARFARSWDHTYNTLYNGQKSGKVLVDLLVALLVKFTEISEPDVIDIASKASGNPIIAIFNKSTCKDSWPFWFIWISYGRYACLGVNCNEFNGILHTYVHCAVTPPGGSAPRTNQEARAQQKQASRVQQQKINEIKFAKIAKSKSNVTAETTDGRAAALDKMAVATVHKNMVEAHRLMMAGKETALQNVKTELEMWDRILDAAEFQACRTRFKEMMEANKACQWMDANPPPTLADAYAAVKYMLLRQRR